jgi:GAF domain-containing protein
MCSPIRTIATVRSTVDPYRTVLSIPMVRADELLGVIVIYRHEVRPFSDSHVSLMETFADQAAIAIENARLLTELQAKNASLTEALEQQTATAEILRVISSSPTAVQPVFDTIAKSVVRLCNGHLSGVYQLVDGLIHFVAHCNWTEEGLTTARRMYPRPPSRDTQVTSAILERRVVEVRDFEGDADVPPESLPLARALGYRSILVVPMLREGVPTGAIAVARSEAAALSSKHVELLQTFADQAVIAIQNVRLFTELEARNAELRVSLEQQTATSELLKVIGRSTFDLQPVFETLGREHGPAVRGRAGVHLPLRRAASAGGCHSQRPARVPEVGRAESDRARTAQHGGAYRPGAAHDPHRRRDSRSRIHVWGEAGRSHPHRPHGPNAPRRRAAGRAPHVPPRGAPVLRRADRPAGDLRRPGRHRHRERSPAR